MKMLFFEKSSFSLLSGREIFLHHNCKYLAFFFLKTKPKNCLRVFLCLHEVVTWLSLIEGQGDRSEQDGPHGSRALL